MVGQIRRRHGYSKVNFQPPDRHQQALAILAIATAAIGVGLFGGGLKINGAGEQLDWPSLMLTIAKSFAILVTVGTYFRVFISTYRILELERVVTGREVVAGPLLWLYWEMLSLALIFLANTYIAIFA